MSQIPAAEVVALAATNFEQNCLEVACIAVLMYDHILTLERDMRLFWCGGALVARIEAFLLQFSILSTSAVFLISLLPQIGSTTRSCKTEGTVDNVIYVLVTAVLASLPPIRTYAVTGGQWAWTTLCLALSLVGVAINIYTAAKQSQMVINFQGTWACMTSVDISASLNTQSNACSENPIMSMAHEMYTVLLASQACTTLSDAVVIVATWLYLYRDVKAQSPNWWRHPQTISWLFFRDGTLYFITMFIGNLVLCVVGTEQQILEWLANVIQPFQMLLLYRLLLNLGEASKTDIYIGSRYSENSWDDSALEDVALSSLRFDHPGKGESRGDKEQQINNVDNTLDLDSGLEGDTYD